MFSIRHDIILHYWYARTLSMSVQVLYIATKETVTVALQNIRGIFLCDAMPAETGCHISGTDQNKRYSFRTESQF